MFAGVSLLPAGAEAELAAGSPVLPQTRSQPAEHRQPWRGAVRSAGPPRGLWVGVHLWPGCMWCNMMMITVMVTTMWPTGSQRTMSSTGFGLDWTAETQWTTAAGNGAMGSLWVKTRYDQTKQLLSKKKSIYPFLVSFSLPTRTSADTTTTSDNVLLQTWALWPGWPCTVTLS